MKSGKQLIDILNQDTSIAHLIDELKGKSTSRIRLKGLLGSFDALLAATVYHEKKKNHLFICNDREEAAYFQNDLSAFIKDTEVMLFPTSYKKPYQYEEIENANVLLRAEVLNKVNQNEAPVIITYPEALCEKVINKKSLVKNSFTIKQGDHISPEFISELLVEYGFTKADFVYEPGQFAQRGGIIDIYSFANEWPYRLEFFGDELESIRTFDPESQLSRNSVKHISIIPDVQTKLLEESRESLFQYLPNKYTVWIKDFAGTLEIIDKSFEKVKEQFTNLIEMSGESGLITQPDHLFDTKEDTKRLITDFKIVEFGKNQYFKDALKIQFSLQPQPSFNKDFQLITDTLEEYQAKDFEIFLAAESEKQLERLRTIFDELGREIEFKTLPQGLREGFVDQDRNFICFTDHQIFERYFKYKTRESFGKSKALTLKELKELQPGDYVTHIDYGIGRFAGMEMIENNGNQQETIRIIYKDNDLLYLSVHSLHKIAKYSSQEGNPPSISKLGSQEWENKKKKVKKKVRELAFDLISLYAKRKAAQGHSFNEDTYLQAELESSFIYEDTPDQARATEDVKGDMESPHPMDRLVCGDVGFGKTEVAIRAAFKAVNDSKQVGVLVPTTILATQHYKTFKERYRDLPVRVDFINRFRTSKEIKQVLRDVKEGKVDVLIGTHRLLSKDVQFKDLGLLIIDEEQKFGVAAKDKMKTFKATIDVLTLTATPIPRTLQFSLMNARDLSVIATPPPNRQSVSTELHVFNEEVIRDAISFELRRGGQVFFVHNRIKDIEEIGNIILRLVPDARIGVAHGQMEGPRLEKVMMRFIDGDYDVLISTNIIESGLDIPNANTIIINQSHMYGLSDLHQMRGRVGRSNKKAFCYLLAPSSSLLSSDARKRLSTLEEFSDLGDGYKIAMRDLDIRGSGDLLGGEQSGFINDLGFETYHKILDETIRELKEKDFKELFEDTPDLQSLSNDCVIETDLSLLIPESYITNISERLKSYNDLDNITNEEDLQKYTRDLQDRFGPMPEEVEELIKSVRLRWQAERLGFDKILIKSEKMKGYVKTEGNDDYFQSDTFGFILQYVRDHPKRTRIKEHKGQMIVSFEEIIEIEEALKTLKQIDKEKELTI